MTPGKLGTKQGRASDIDRVVRIEQGSRQGIDIISGSKSIVDCGFPLNVSMRHFRSSGRKADRIQEGVWIAAIGRLHYSPTQEIDNCAITRFTPNEGFILDMQPESTTFGSIIPWAFDKRLP